MSLREGIRRSLLAVPVITMLGLFACHAIGQTVYDLHSIEPDVKIIGSGYLSQIYTVAILDIDHSGAQDLFFRDGNSHTVFGENCVFGYLDFSTRHEGAVVDVADGSYDIVIIGDRLVNHYLGGSLAHGDWNHDGLDDLAIGDPVAYQLQHFAQGTVYVFWGGSQWQPGTIIDLAEQPADIFIYSSDISLDPKYSST